jgi:ATP/maltotriose-dependent transcriptional regulator MalT
MVESSVAAPERDVLLATKLRRLADDAIGHAAAAGEMLWAARIIEQYFDVVFYIRGEAATIHRWMSVLPR